MTHGGARDDGCLFQDFGAVASEATGIVGENPEHQGSRVHQAIQSIAQAARRRNNVPVPSSVSRMEYAQGWNHAPGDYLQLCGSEQGVNSSATHFSARIDVHLPFFCLSCALCVACVTVYGVPRVTWAHPMYLKPLSY